MAWGAALKRQKTQKKKKKKKNLLRSHYIQAVFCWALGNYKDEQMCFLSSRSLHSEGGGGHEISLQRLMRLNVGILCTVHTVRVLRDRKGEGAHVLVPPGPPLLPPPKHNPSICQDLGPSCPFPPLLVQASFCPARWGPAQQSSPLLGA